MSEFAWHVQVCNCAAARHEMCCASPPPPCPQPSFKALSCKVPPRPSPEGWRPFPPRWLLTPAFVGLVAPVQQSCPQPGEDAGVRGCRDKLKHQESKPHCWHEYSNLFVPWLPLACQLLSALAAIFASPRLLPFPTPGLFPLRRWTQPILSVWLQTSVSCLCCSQLARP
jgi:hypothetical protein